MKRFILILSSVFLTVATVSHAVDGQKQFGISNFTGGLNTNYDPISIQDNEVSSSLNMLFDKDNSADLREGFSSSISSSSLSYVGSWSYTDATATNWIVVLSSDAIRAGAPGGSFTVKIATVPSNSTINAVVALNTIWFTDQTQGVYFWNGTSTTYVSGSPRGKYIDTFRNRILVTGLAAPNQNQVYLSGYLNGQNWTTGNLSTDAAILPMGLQDSQDLVTGTFTGFNDVALVFKKQSIWAIFGFDNSDFQVKTLNREVGCIDQRSIQPFRGGVIFASLRALEYFDGSNAYPISDKIKNLIDPALNTAFNAHTWTQDSQTDFDAGSIVPTRQLSTSISPGNVTVSSFTVTESGSASGWSSGSPLSFAVGSSSLTLSMNNSGTVTNAGFESALSGNWTNSGVLNFTRTTGISGGTCSSLTAQEGSAWLQASNYANFIASIIDLSGNTLASVTPTVTDDSTWRQATISTSGNVGKRFKMRFSAGVTNDPIITTSDSYILGGDITFYYAACHQTGPTINHINVDNVQNGSNTITTGSFTSQIFDTGFTSSTAQLQWNATINTSTPSFSVISATANPSNNWFQILSSSSTNATGSRYLRYVSTLTLTGADQAFTSITGVTILSRSTGTYYSAVNFAPNLSSWELFSVNKQDNGGSIAFYVRASTGFFAVASSTPLWTAQTANAVVNYATGTYMQMRADFLLTAATHTPTINDFSFSWFEGTQPPAMASAVHKDRYFLSITTNTSSSGNDSTFVLGRNFSLQNPVWSLWDIKAGTYLVHLGNLYHGNNAANGKFYRDFIGTDDNGTAITGYLWTKDYALGDITKEKLFDTIYLTSLAQGSDYVNTSYYLNRDRSTAYSLASYPTNEQSGLNVIRVPFPIGSASQPNFGKTISFKWSPTFGNQDWKFFGGVLNFRERMTQ